MRERHDRHAHAGHPPDLGGEHAAGVDDDLGLDRPPLGLHAAHPPRAAAALLDVDRGHARVREHAAAALARAVGERRRQLRGVEVAVGRQVGAAADAVGAHQREQLLGLLRRDELQRQAERLRPRDLAQHLLFALRRARQPDAAALDPAAVERAVQLDRVDHHPRQRDARAQLPDEAGRVERRAARQLVAVEQHDVALAELREVVRDRRAADAAADDHDARARRQLARPDHQRATAASHSSNSRRATVSRRRAKCSRA